MNSKEEALLFELVSRSNGYGDGVALYPFESVLRDMFENKVDGKLAIYSLQKQGIIQINEKAGWDEFRKRSSLYPVYIVTTDGWEYALKARGEELKIKEKIEQESLDDIDLPDFLKEDDQDELDD